MQYQQNIAIDILRKMEEHIDGDVPNLHESLDSNTELPPRTDIISITTPKITLGPDLGAKLRSPSLKTETRVANKTHPQSWIGEMNVTLLLQHAKWLKEEGFITVYKEGYPKSLNFKAVRFLKNVDKVGGWQKALEIAKESDILDTLSDMEALLKAKQRKS